MAEIRKSRNDVGKELRHAPIFVLVAPQMGENIGATARAMMNFGISELRLVMPRDGWPSDAATAMASGALDLMPAVQVYASTKEAVADCQFVAATTARSREILLPVLEPQNLAQDIKARIESDQKCAVLFGGERSGLSNEDLQVADVIVSIPVNPAFASLNLAQAALLVGYEWAKADGRTGYESDLELVKPADRDDFNRLLEHLFGALERAGYFFPPERRSIRERNLSASLLRAGLTGGEVRAWRGVIKALEQRKMKERP